VLLVTNFYPPHELGGQGKSCQQVVAGLQERGHETLVLTSMHGTDNVPVDEDGISRSLYLEMDLAAWRHSLVFFTSRRQREEANLARCAAVLQRFTPDIIFLWGMWNFPRSLPAFFEAQRPHAVAYRFAEYWPTLPSQHLMYWEEPGRTWFSRLPKRAVAAVARGLLARETRDVSLSFEHAYCVSAATRDWLVAAGIPVEHARVIHTGLDASSFLKNGPARQATAAQEGLQLLYAGRLAREKGVESLIVALNCLVQEHGIDDVHLQIAGSGRPKYENELKALVQRLALQDHVTFLGSLPAAEIPDLMHRCHVLVVPSIWAEPFPRVVLEGMASGLVVVASTVGGTSEIVGDGENGLLFAAGESDRLAELLGLLNENESLRTRLAQRGRQTVVEEYTLAHMMDEIEDFLQGVALGAAAPAVRAS
jgi:glycosyltransferase involved in cell wall biosynthesis